MPQSAPLPLDAHSPASSPRPIAGGLPAPARPVDQWPIPNRGEPWQPKCPQNLRAAILVTVPALPPVALIAMVVNYLVPGPVALHALDPLLGGLLIAGLFCALAALVMRFLLGGTSADQANTTSFNQIRERLHELDARLAVAAQRADPATAADVACRRARALRAQIRVQLEQSALDWVQATGYISIWKLLHRAEEALLMVDSVHDVLGAVLFDDLRLSGAAIPNGDHLRAKLRHAASNLTGMASAYLEPVPATASAEARSVPDPASAPIDAQDQESVSRAALREVRRAINEFRDGSFEAMVRTRNHLLATLTLTGLAAVLIAATAIATRERAPVTDPSTDPIVGAAVFYLVGALVGLFNRLRNESGRADDIEDYGLTAARIALTPVLSGLGAVAGVAITAMLTGGTNLPSLLSAGGAGVSSAPVGVPGLASIYSLGMNQFGIVIAAVFGLTPTLLIGALQNQADTYRDNIKSTTSHTS
jgi:hypothetical protein